MNLFFSPDALHDIHRLFENDYYACDQPTTNDLKNSSINFTTADNAVTFDQIDTVCRKDRPILAVFLMLATSWLATKLSNLNQTSFFTRSKRELISDYSLPIAILFFSLISNTVFNVSSFLHTLNFNLLIHLEVIYSFIILQFYSFFLL